MLNEKELTYLNSVIDQYTQANRIKNIDILSKSFIEEFVEYLKHRTISGEKYLHFLEEIGLDYDLRSEETFEVGKGILDTITTNTGMSIITPNTKDLTNSKIFEGKLIVCHDVPYVLNGSTVNIDQISNRFITQNPYPLSEMFGWEQLHNSGRKNITVGIYGSVYDADFNKKMKQLERFKDRLNEDNLIVEYTTINDDYLAVVSSHRPCKRLIKRR